MATYSIWQGEEITMVQGTDPPTYQDGTLQDPSAVRWHIYEASDMDEAMAMLDEIIEHMAQHRGHSNADTQRDA
jgi:hypothetical protein